MNFEVGPKGEPNEIESLMLESDDGFIWHKRATFQEIAGDETAFIFDRRGDILGIGRRRGTAQITAIGASLGFMVPAPISTGTSAVH